MPNGREVRCTSVIARIGEPSPVTHVAVDAIKSYVTAAFMTQSHIPLFPVPRTDFFVHAFSFWLLRPPIAGRPPRACRPQDCSLQIRGVCFFSRRCHCDRASFVYLDMKLPRWTKGPQG